MLALTIFTNPKDVGLGYTLNESAVKSWVDNVVGVTSAQVVPILNSSNKIEGVSPVVSCLKTNLSNTGVGPASVSVKSAAGSVPPKKHCQD